MTILHSSEASTSKYAGFSLLVNNSGAVLCFFLEHTRWFKLLHVFFLKLEIHQGHNWVQGIFLVCTSRTAFGQICTLWVVFSLSFPFDCHIWRKILIESIHERIIIQPFSILFGGIGWFKQDEFAILPAVVPEGPIAILGLVCFPWHLLAFLSCAFTFVIIHSVVDWVTFLCVFPFEEPVSFLGCLWRVAQDRVKLRLWVIYWKGGGTAARILLTVWPSQTLEGWEIDEMVSYRVSYKMSLHLKNIKWLPHIHFLEYLRLSCVQPFIVMTVGDTTLSLSGSQLQVDVCLFGYFSFCGHFL